MPSPSSQDTAYRLVKQRRPPLDTSGSNEYGGRWNSIGTPVLYLTSTQALCILEARVHTTRLFRHAQWTMCTIAFPSKDVKTIEDLGLTLPQGWDSKPRSAASMLFGDNWIRSGTSLGLYVPSAVSPEDMNLILNPVHPSFRHVKLIRQAPHQLDPRLF